MRGGGDDEPEDTLPASGSAAGGQRCFTGATPNRDAALPAVGVRYKTSSGLAGCADYEATVGQREIDHSVIAGLRFTW